MNEQVKLEATVTQCDGCGLRTAIWVGDSERDTAWRLAGITEHHIDGRVKHICRYCKK